MINALCFCDKFLILVILDFLSPRFITGLSHVIIC